MENKKNFSKSLARIFLIAIIVNTILMIMLVVLGNVARKAGLRQMDDMGTITLQALKGARPMFWNMRGIDSPQLSQFLNELTAQSTVQNVFMYDMEGNILFTYKELDNEMLIYPAPAKAILRDKKMFIYSDSTLPPRQGMRQRPQSEEFEPGQEPWHAQGHHYTLPNETIIGIELNASGFAAMMHLRLASLTMALLIEVILILLYRHFRVILASYEQSQRSLHIAQQEAATGRLASILAHEIKNPLSSIKGLVSYAAKKSTDATVLDNLERTVEEVDRLTDILNGFLSFGKPVDLEKTEFSLREMLEKSKELLHHDIIKSGNSINVTGGDVTLYADYNKLLQVFVNLILNAVEASPAGASIEINTDAATRRTTITNRLQEGVTVDTERIFEPFYTTKAHGNGLGLAIARKLLELHGYNISVAEKTPFKIHIDWKTA